VAKKILLADDSLTIQKVVELTFSDSEYDLVCVSNGQRALDRVAEQMPDLILADVVMPEKNGYEVCEAIKANPSTARIPVVLLSGTFEPFDRDRAERLGCDAIVSKPFDSQQLLRQVEALLARAPGDIPSTATMRIPTMTNPVPPPPPAALERAPTEPGFSSEDFTGRIRIPAGVGGGPDLFEEEYGQADVESAIAAFEKAHPEFSSAEGAEKTVSISPKSKTGRETDEAAPDAAREQLAGWLREEPERPTAPNPARPSPAPAPFWVPREPEPDLQPIPFGGDDSGARHLTPQSEAEPMRADEAPTQQIRLGADFAAFDRPTGSSSSDRITDETSPPQADDERTAEISIAETSALFGARETEAAPAPSSPLEEEAPVSKEIEVLAQTTSIGQLKEMLSSVSRGEGSLTDDEIDRLASRVVERLSEKIVREIAWEVIPDVAEIVIKQRIKELEAGVE
jgi:CheY-like chemotaxis protein